ncbi:hypothetical protein Tco_1458135 [Tanacetum coccineum]
MVYLGNEQGSKAYRLFDPTIQRICVSRDVKFKENETWDWKDYMSELIKYDLNGMTFRIADDEPKNYKISYASKTAANLMLMVEVTTMHAILILKKRIVTIQLNTSLLFTFEDPVFTME